jgi:hypothetical protein
MDLYEVHVPCGQKVVVICKENGEDVKILKNGKPIYKENENEKKTNNGATGASGNTGVAGTSGSNGNQGASENMSNLPRVFDNAPNPTRNNRDPTKNYNLTNPPRSVPDQEEEEEESETTVENNMAGGKKSRRNNARKNNATRRKQAGGKRGPNGYMKFANKIRPQILKEHPELKSDVVGVARKIGEKWRALSDAEKKKY